MYRLMVVDDEDIVRRSLIKNIRWADYNFEVVADAASVKEALEKIEIYKPDLLITDIKMPEISGLELIKACKDRAPKLVTIILSAYDDFSYAQYALYYGVSGYLLKPIEKQALDELMHKVLREIRNAEMQTCLVIESYKSSTDENEDIVGRAKEYIMKHFDSKLTLEIVAKSCYTNPTYLSNVFKSKMGCNFVDYVNSLKIEKAKQMLQYSKYKVKDIAIKIGYEDYTYFCKVFKKNTGETPLQYRCKHQGVNL